MILKIFLLASVFLSAASTPLHPEARQGSGITSAEGYIDNFLEGIADQTFQEIEMDDFVQETMFDILEDQLDELKEKQEQEMEELEDIHETQTYELRQLQDEETDELEYLHDLDEEALEIKLSNTQVNNKIWKDTNKKHLLGLLNSILVRITEIYSPVVKENSKINVNDKLMPDSTLLEKAQQIKSNPLMKINLLGVKENSQLENSLTSIVAEKTEDKRNNIRTYIQNKPGILEEQIQKYRRDKMQQELENMRRLEQVLEKQQELKQEAQSQLKKQEESPQLHQNKIAEQLQNLIQLETQQKFENQFENQHILEQEPENPLTKLEHLLNQLEIQKEQKIPNQHGEQQETQNQLQIKNQNDASTHKETKTILQQFLDIKEHLKQQDTPSTFGVSFDLREDQELENEPHSRNKRSPREKRLLGAFNFGNFNKKSEDRLEEINVRVNELLRRISEFEKIRAKASSLKVLDTIEDAFSNRCPPNTNSLRVGDKCFEHVTNLWMDYDSALIYCSGRGGALAIPDLEDDDYLTNLRDTFPGLADNSVLVGITDIHQEGTFQFLDGSPAGSERFYESTHPVYAEKDCVSLTPYQGFGLVDTACDRLHEVLCEYDLVNLLSVNV